MLDFFKDIKLIDESNYSAVMLGKVEPYLKEKRSEGFFEASEGQKLHYEAYEKLLSRGSVIILHGFTESAEKFREVSYYFLKAGYSVFALDMTGHGKSYHASEKAERVEIDSFDTYADDLDIFIREIVVPASSDRDIYIYSHSLGSTVALLYLMQHKGTVKKAVLSSPMVCGNMGMPVPVAGTVARFLCALGGKKFSAPGRCVFDPAQPPEKSDATSPERFLYYLNKRVNEPLYQTSGPSFGWVKASLEARSRLLSDAVKKIDAELIIFLPEEDKQLLSSYTEKLVELADIKIRKVKGSRHEIFMSENKVLEWYYDKILDFLED